jgi:hypothetical protein
MPPSLIERYGPATGISFPSEIDIRILSRNRLVCVAL